jgi:predicted ATPase
MLLLCSYRPGYRPPWMEKSYATQVALPRLDPEESLGAVRAVLQMDQIPASLAQVILDRAKGNPFFLEEVARVVGEQDGLHSTLEVPDTIQGVLTARIERLSDGPKELLQTAPILGREVSLGLLKAVWEGSASLEPHLAQLIRLEFLYEERGGEVMNRSMSSSMP